MTTLPKGATFDTSNLQPGEIIHTDFTFYNVTSIRGFTSILSVICENTIMLWEFLTASKRAPVHTIRFILTTLENEQRPCKFVRVDEDCN